MKGILSSDRTRDQRNYWSELNSIHQMFPELDQGHRSNHSLAM